MMAARTAMAAPVEESTSTKNLSSGLAASSCRRIVGKSLGSNGGTCRITAQPENAFGPPPQMEGWSHMVTVVCGHVTKSSPDTSITEI